MTKQERFEYILEQQQERDLTTEEIEWFLDNFFEYETLLFVQQ